MLAAAIVRISEGSPRRRSGFSLVELLVAVAIVATLMGLLVPAAQAAREAARRRACASNLRQLGLGLVAHESSKQRFPAGYVADPARTPRDPDTRDTPPGTGWGLLIAAYIEEGKIADRYRPNLGIADPANAEVVSAPLPLFRCPSDTGPREAFAVQLEDGRPHPSAARLGRSSYVGNAGHHEPWSRPLDSWASVANGPLYRNSWLRIARVSDGTSKTVFLGEHLSRLSQKAWAGTVPGAFSQPTPEFVQASGSAPDAAATLLLVHSGPTADEPGVIHPPNDEHAHVCQMYSDHPNGSNVMFGDGGVRFITDAIDRSIWAALSSHDGGELVSDDAF